MSTEVSGVGTDQPESKHDDFFDNAPKPNRIITPEPLKQNGDLPSEDPPKQNGDHPSEDPPKQNGDLPSEEPPTVNGDLPSEEPPTINGDVSPLPPESENKTKDGDNTEAAQIKDTDQNNEGTGDDAVVAPSEEHTSEAAPEETTKEADGGADDVVQVNGDGGDNDGAGTKDEQTDEGFQSTSPTQAGESGSKADDAEEQEPEAATPTIQNTDEDIIDPVPPSEPKEKTDNVHLETPECEERRTPSGGEDDYEDSFSDIHSEKNESTTEGSAVPVVTMETQEESQTPVVNEEQEKEGDTGQDPQRTAVSPSPSDSRAEATSVVPVVAVMEDTAKKDDGRSSATIEDQGESFRGEDRKEEPAPEGSEDCRGQGQWKSEEQQFIASAMLVQKSDKEALDEAVQDRERLMQEYSDAKVKDLQERLAILARENEQKEKRIGKLEEDLKDVTEKLRETERKLFASEVSNSQHTEAAPKSKTCTIM